MPYPKFKVGDRVRLVCAPKGYPGVANEMEEVMERIKVFTIREVPKEVYDGNQVYRFNECKKDGFYYWWNEKWLELDGPPLSKEDKLNMKINTLWERSDWGKNHATISRVSI